MGKSFEQIAKELDASREIITNGVDVLRKFIDKQAGQIADRDQRIAALEAELSPWRQMMAQLEALRGGDWYWYWSISDFLSVYEKVTYKVVVYNDKLQKHRGEGDTLPAAVAAAYEQVMGVSGTKIVKLIKLTERGKWHINERGFPVCGASLELDPIDEMEIERRILHEHAGVCVVCKREFKGVGDE